VISAASSPRPPPVPVLVASTSAPSVELLARLGRPVARFRSASESSSAWISLDSEPRESSSASARPRYGPVGRRLTSSTAGIGPTSPAPLHIRSDRPAPAADRPCPLHSRTSPLLCSPPVAPDPGIGRPRRCSRRGSLPPPGIILYRRESAGVAVNRPAPPAVGRRCKDLAAVGCSVS
jgi:hypothetical protein